MPGKSDEAQREMIRTLLKKGVEMGVGVGLAQALESVGNAAYVALGQDKLWSPARRAMEKAYGQAGLAIRDLIMDKGWRGPVVAANTAALFNGIIEMVEKALAQGNGRGADASEEEADAKET